MKLRMILTLALVLGSFAGAHAAADEDAAQWMEKLFGLMSDNAVQTDFKVIVSAEIDGQQLNANVTGELIHADPMHYVNSLEMQMVMPGMGSEPMAMTSRQIADGETMWAETHLAAMGMTQIGKISLAELEALMAEQSGLELSESALYMDPMSQLKSILDAFDVSILEITGGEVRLSLVPTAETMKGLAEEMDGKDLDIRGTLILREEDAVPVSAKIMLDPQSRIEMSFENFSLLVRDDIPAETFLYTPPEGAQVVDMAPLLRAGM
jgi:outer membrane lipoprotein-sorting protein